MKILVNSACPDEMPQNVAFPQGPHCSQIAKIETIYRDELYHISGILVSNPLACTFNISKEFGSLRSICQNFECLWLG